MSRIVEIRANLDMLEIGDLELLERAGKKDLSYKEQIALLDRVIVGGARKLPLKEYGRAVEAVMSAVMAAMNGTDETGKN
jgi:hypothetical protein